MNLITTKKAEKLLLHYTMLTRQITAISDCLIHIIRLNQTHQPQKHKGQTLDIKGFKSYIQTEIADITTYCQKICNDLNINFEETLQLGQQREQEKKKEFTKKHPQEHWI